MVFKWSWQDMGPFKHYFRPSFWQIGGGLRPPLSKMESAASGRRPSICQKLERNCYKNGPRYSRGPFPDPFFIDFEMISDWRILGQWMYGNIGFEWFPFFPIFASVGDIWCIMPTFVVPPGVLLLCVTLFLWSSFPPQGVTVTHGALSTSSVRCS